MTKSPDSGDKRYLRGQSFLVEVKFRENNCWQGTVQWLEGEKTCSFRSILEMLSLMRQATELSASPEERQEIRTWDDTTHQHTARLG